MLRSLLLALVFVATAASDVRAVASRVSGPSSSARLPTATLPRPVDTLEPVSDDPPIDANGRAWPFAFNPFYWGPQGTIIGPPWFGGGVGGGNWRVLPNRTPFGPPGSNVMDLLHDHTNEFCPGFNSAHSVHATLATAAPFQAVEVCSNFPCQVYTCRLGTKETSTSTLSLYKNDEGDVFARLRCFKLLDDFDEFGCREWDRLKLSQGRTDENYECALPFLLPSEPVDATSEWENTVENRQSKLECVGKLPDDFAMTPP